MLFGARETRLAWHVVADTTDAVVDAATGKVVYRASLTKSFTNYPGAAVGGGLAPEPLGAGWLSSTTVFAGPWVRAYADLDDDNMAEPGEEADPDVAPSWNGSGCGPPPGLQCSWDGSPATATQNKDYIIRQLFWYANHFREHLAADPIGFDGFRDQDRVIVEGLDGAGRTSGPDADHLSNATMSTPAEGQPPRMQMFLFGAPFRTVHGGDDARVVYHEYTHGLTSRLVTNADGTQALNSPQAGALAEGLSDWYALDLLDREGLGGSLDMGEYTDAAPHQLRRQPIDCAVGSTEADCPGSGLTFGDFGRLDPRGPEVHADGEIWAQALWDVRRAVGSTAAEALVTQALALAPPEPSFLDLRNAMLQADTALSGGARHAQLWEAFARRGMGFYAGTADSSDIAPVEDFSAPPPPGAPTGTIAGRVTSADSGLPMRDVPVGIGGLATSTAAGPVGPHYAAATGADGTYAIGGVPQGRYPRVHFRPGGGYEPAVARDVTVAAGAVTAADVALERNWAAAAGGGRATSADASEYADAGCGPAGLVDQAQGAGWSADNDGAVSAVIQLPVSVDVTAFGLDLSNTCGDGVEAMTRDLRIETSSNGVDFFPAFSGTFGPDARGRLTRVAPTAGRFGVRFVKLTLLSAQQADSRYVDFSELAVFGSPPNALPSGVLAVSAAAARPGDVLTFDASSFTDPDSAITGYDWDFDGDGRVDRTTAEPATTFAYASQGTFEPRVAVRDFRGGAGQAGATVRVSPTVVPKRKPKLTLRTTGRRGRITFKVSCPDACRVGARLVTDRGTQKRLKLRRRTAATVRTRTVRGTRTLTVKVVKSTLTALKRRRTRTLRAALEVKASVPNGPRTSQKKRVRITR
ncbi:MAG: M36 family metallopeptidase [Solirubrobacterales bacterium]|nr:M36 family metallopeptidase [Solirubrobacterales bacterium]